MIIVSGHLRLRPGTREHYLETCREVVLAARQAPGCVDFALTADRLDPDCVRVLEVWDDPAALAAFRGDGVGDEQGSMIEEVDVREHDATPRWGRAVTSPAAA